MQKKFRSEAASIIYKSALELFKNGNITEAEFHEFDGCLVSKTKTPAKKHITVPVEPVKYNT
ncbi:hypothetical protein FACS1894164_11130 [Spirochaetia bacterium]|nr:hypothetical protein FACS1894164_11130 [Spirochaetia bacterium]